MSVAVSFAISPELVEVIDVHGARSRHARGVERLQACQVEQCGLAMEYATPQQHEHSAELVWLLPRAGVRLVRYRSRHRHAKPEASVLTAARIETTPSSWTCRSLVLALQMPQGQAPRIVGSGEFADAVTCGRIHPDEAEYALRTVHRTFTELHHDRDLTNWLTKHGITTS